MKITKVEVLRVKTNRPSWRPIFCRIHTDEGIYGDGEAAMAYDAGAPAAYAMIKDLAPTLIGMDPMQIEWIWETFFRTTFWGLNAGPVMYSAMSAIDIALWDIKGKAYGRPLHEIFGAPGGKTSAPMPASFSSDGPIRICMSLSSSRRIMPMLQRRPFLRRAMTP